jgi:hypothetical protein
MKKGLKDNKSIQLFVGAAESYNVEATFVANYKLSIGPIDVDEFDDPPWLTIRLERESGCLDIELINAESKVLDFSPAIENDLNNDLSKYFRMFLQEIKKWVRDNGQNVSRELPFGQHLFGEPRKKPEVDTKKEQDVYNNLEYWVEEHSVERGFEEDVDGLIDLLDQGKYEDVLKPESGYVYRGMAMPTIFVKDKMGMNIFDNASYDNPIIALDKRIDFNPRGRAGFSSWSYNILTAQTFSSINSDTADIAWGEALELVSVILRASIPEDGDFMLNHKEIPVLKKMKESEVLTLGKVRCSVILIPFGMILQQNNGEISKKKLNSYIIDVIREQGDSLFK